jgi:hypothetical protein
MYMETCFGFTQGLPPTEFYEDVLFSWFTNRVSFDSPGLLHWFVQGINAQLSTDM